MLEDNKNLIEQFNNLVCQSWIKREKLSLDSQRLLELLMCNLEKLMWDLKKEIGEEGKGKPDSNREDTIKA